MILHGIKAQNFMSLRNCCIDELDDHLNFLVGPNGCGKTTVFRALKTVRDIFSFNRPVTFDQLCSRGVNPKEIDLTIDIEFNTSWEQELITAFLCASLSRPYELPNILTPVLPQPIAPVPSEGNTAFSEWLLHIFRPEILPFLFRGKLHVSYRGQNYENLRITYTVDQENIPITIFVRPFDSVLIRGNVPENIPGGYSSMNGLVEFFQSTSSLLDIVNLLTRQGYPSMNSIDPVACLLYLSEKRAMLGIDMNAQQAYLPAQRRFAELSGNLNIVSIMNQSFRFGNVLQTLLKQAFVFTNNLRVPIEDIATFSKEEIAKSEIDLENEQNIPLLLYHLKNGDFAERAHFERIRKSFKKLAGDDSDFDIHAGFGSNEQSALSINIQITDSEGEIPLTYHGAGIWEVLMLSTVLDESEGRVVLLDEPASNLHPGMQHKLVEVLHTVPGQVIVVTHSAHMLPTRADDFRKVRRMQKNSKGTRIGGLGNSAYPESERIEKELNRSSDVAGLLFASGVLLVEGETETGALNEWFPKSTAGQGLTFADHNLALYSVGGKDSFPFYLHFLTEFGVPWTVICDGDALVPNSNLWKALKHLNAIPNVPNAATFEALKALAETAGVYTANTSFSGKFESIPDVKSYENNNWTPTESKVRKGRYIAQHIPCPAEVEEILQRALQWLGPIIGNP